LKKLVASSGAEFVTFDSRGGNISSAMRIGRAIRASGVSTLQIRSNECASACALAFLGGVARNADPGSIGVHQSSFSADAELDSNAATTAVQLITAEILDYIIEMGV